MIKVFSIDKNILSNDLLTTSEISFLREVNTFINLTHELEEQKSYLEKTVYAIPSALLGISSEFIACFSTFRKSLYNRKISLHNIEVNTLNVGVYHLLNSRL